MQKIGKTNSGLFVPAFLRTSDASRPVHLAHLLSILTLVIGLQNGFGAENSTNSLSGKKGAEIVEITNAISQLPYHKVFVLSVGVSKYPRSSDRLNYADSDAKKFGQVLSDKYAFTVSKLLLNSDATRENILKEIDKLKSELSPEGRDDFIFYFSGHGLTATEPAKGSEAQGQRHGFILPYSERVSLETKSYDDLVAGALSLKDLTDRIIALETARHRIIFLDSCFSGLALKEQRVLTKFPDDAYESVLNKKSIQLVTAGLDTEFSYEDDKDLKQSVFMSALLKTLQDPKVRTMEEVFYPLRVEVHDYFASRGEARMMTPQHRYLVYDEGTFVFVPPARYKTWSGNSPLLFAGLKGAKGNGTLFDRKVTEDEVREVKYKRYELTDAQIAEKKERFEYRASIGDPVAAYGISELYRLGIGTTRDKNRSKLWMAEARDAGDSNAQVKQDMQKAFAVMAVMHSGASPEGIVGLMGAFDQGPVEGFKGDFKGALDELGKNNRSASNDKLKGMREKLKDIVGQSAGKITAEETAEINRLLDFVQQEIDFGAYAAAREDLAEVPGLFSPISGKFPTKDQNERKNQGFPFKPF